MRRTAPKVRLTVENNHAWRAQNQRQQETAIAHFERNVRPLLLGRCVKCHGSKKVEGGLRLDSAAGLRRGGESGPVVDNERPQRSRILVAVRRVSDFKMPPDGKLKPSEIADLEQWIRLGAVWGNADRVTSEIESASTDHWAFQPIRRGQPPSTKDKAWAQSPIDQFVLACMEADGLRPAPRANRRTLLRRVTFDLTGLPPTPDEIHEFLLDESPDAFAKVVDRLLASPHYGERWGRHWLDVARYADSNGLDENMAYASAYHYRDYVIDAFNRDKPFDEFVRAQLAGDLLSEPSQPSGIDDDVWEARLIALAAERTKATGFLALGPKGLREVDGTKMELDIIDDQIATVGKAFLGLTLECSRCHDHKFDPISTEDYYALAGIFKSTRTMQQIIDKRGKGNGIWLEREIALDAPAMVLFRQRDVKYRKELRRLEKQLGTDLTKILRIAAEKRSDAQKGQLSKLVSASPKRAEIVKQWNQLASAAPKKPLTATAMSVQEGQIQNVRVHRRGSHLDLGNEVARRFPEVLTRPHRPSEIGSKQSGRLQMARWLTDPRHPLTSRVIVNRIWQWHFGTGLVDTPDNFGHLGTPPTHPELLDWLASEFMSQGWSIKRLHRMILLSSAYQIISRTTDTPAVADKTRYSFQRRRLDAEEIRDSLLFVAGSLDTTLHGSLLKLKSRQYVSDAKTGKHLVTYDNRRRSVYQPVIRNKVYELFRIFDFPNPSLVSGQRSSTTVPPQLLLMMNSELVVASARSMAKHILEQKLDEKTDTYCIRLAYETAYGRLPDEQEIKLSVEFIDDYRATVKSASPAEKQAKAWQSFCQALILANEFIYLE